MRLLSVTLPYLLLVSFYSGNLNDFGRDKIAAINLSPYNGVAVPLIGAYNTADYTTDDFHASVKRINKYSDKDVWPWVFFNRFIGHMDDGRSHSPKSSNAYFKSIKGIDLYNEAGALEDFYQIWRMSLSVAKKLGSPGIVVDPEAYNDYNAYKVSYIASIVNLSEAEVEERLSEIGRELARIADETYPEATLWFLFTGLGNPVRSLNPFADKEYRTVTYIIEGMLEYAKEHGSKLKFVSGGEISVGYCSKSLDDLKKKIRSRRNKFNASLKSYPNLLIGGTIAPWSNAALKKEGYFAKGTCGESKLKNLKDFKPLIKNLYKSYKYVWIYAAGAVKYNPYNEKIAREYDEAIDGARDDNS